MISVVTLLSLFFVLTMPANAGEQVSGIATSGAKGRA
jgi:hypothetical protein